ncbi:hypothetical protein [Bradyrhizobium sp. USDA 4506]
MFSTCVWVLLELSIELWSPPRMVAPRAPRPSARQLSNERWLPVWPEPNPLPVGMTTRGRDVGASPVGRLLESPLAAAAASAAIVLW